MSDETNNDCDCEGCQAMRNDRHANFIQSLVNATYESLANYGYNLDEVSDEDFEKITNAALSLVKSTLDNDLEVFDLSDVKKTISRNMN